MFLFFFACSADFASHESREPTYVNEDSISPFDNVRNDASIHQGDLYFTSEESFASFCEDYTSVSGNVHIFGQEIHSLEGLSCLEKVQGTIQIEFTNSSSLHGLESLSVITEDLIVTRNPSLSNLEGLESLDNLNGNLNV
jgi:hypothetical protein